METERRTLKRKPLADCTNTSARTLTKPSKPLKPAGCTNTFARSLTKPSKPLNPKEKPVSYETSIGSNTAENPRGTKTLAQEPSTPPPKPANLVEDDLDSSKVSIVYSRRQAVNRTKDRENAVSVPTKNQKDKRKPDLVVLEKTKDKRKAVSVVLAYPKDEGKPDSVVLAKAKDKGKAVSGVPCSYSPLRRLGDIWDELDKGQGDNSDSGDSDNGDSDSINKGKNDVFSKSCPVPHPKTKKKRRFSLPQDFIEKQRAYFAEVDAFELQEEVASDSDVEQ